MTRWIESISLYLLLVVVGVRPLIGESYDSGGSPLGAALTSLLDPSPVRTLLIDGVIVLALLGWLLARAAGSQWKYRWTGIEVGAVLVAVGGVVSCCVAGNKRLAINATVDWLCLPIFAIVVAQLVRRPWQVRLALCVILATAIAQAAECVNQVLYTFADSAENYFEQKETFWAAQGVALDSPQVEMFERRLAAREASGHMWHSNVAGAYLVLTAFAAIGLAIGKWRGPAARFRKGFALCTAVVGLALLATVGLTRSVGAIAAGCVGAVLVIACGVLRGWVDRHRRVVLVLGWAGVVGVVGAVVGHGLRHGSLPGSSLNFRWQYWTTSARMVAEHPLTGTGMENFGRHYLLHKPIASPEEVQNPHNFLVSAAADWGVVGLVGILAMLAGGSIVLCRAPAANPGKTSQAAEEAGSPVRWLVVLGIGIFAPRVFLLGSDNPHFLFWATAFPSIIWLIVFAMLALETEYFRPFRSSELRGLPLVLNCGLIAFLVSELVNFALLVPASATTFFALLGVAVAVRSVPTKAKRPTSPISRWVPVAVVVVMLVALGVGIIHPMARAWWHLGLARMNQDVVASLPLVEQPAYREYTEAAKADALDPAPLAKCANWLVGYADLAGGLREALGVAVEQMDGAIARDPHSVPLHRNKRALCLLLADATGEPEAYRGAVETAQRVIELYPESPSDVAALGESLLRAGETTEEPKELRRAIREFERALELDAARPDWEEVRRFSEAKRGKILERIATARRLLDERPQ